MRSTTAIAAGAALGGALTAPRLFAGGLARTPKAPADPKPIPGGFEIGGTLFHVRAPGLPGADPPDAEPSTITDFNGAVGLAFIDGLVTRRNRVTNQVVDLPFLASDMRYMDGVYRGVDGHPRQGTFALI